MSISTKSTNIISSLRLIDIVLNTMIKHPWKSMVYQTHGSCLLHLHKIEDLEVHIVTEATPKDKQRINEILDCHVEMDLNI